MSRRSIILSLAVIIVLVVALTRRDQAASRDQTLRVAVASNFQVAAKELAEAFERETGQKIVLMTGSTGQLYAQIVNGAPIDAFFAADVKRPEILQQEGRGRERFSYALGRLVLWSSHSHLIDDRAQILKTREADHLALANPNLAPYGAAAKEVMENLSLWDHWDSHRVTAENVGQVYQYIHSGNAELGFVSLAQINQTAKQDRGSSWLVPANLHTPIEQQAVLTSDSELARKFFAFVKSEEGAEIIRRHGYEIP